MSFMYVPNEAVQRCSDIILIMGISSCSGYLLVVARLHVGVLALPQCY